MTLAEFLAARLDEDQARAEAMHHDVNPLDDYYSCPASRTEPLGDLAWGEEHCECGLAMRKGRVLREVAAKRAILALHPIASEEIWTRDDDDHPVKVREYDCYRCGWVPPDVQACGTLRALAAVYSDHPDDRQEWKP